MTIRETKREKTMQEYHYTESGLRHVYLEGGQILRDDGGEKVISIPAVNVLHRLLAQIILTAKCKLADDELRFVRTELGLTQAQLAELLHCKPLTVGRWERGETPMPATAEALFRKLACEQLRIRISMHKLNAYSATRAAPHDIRVDASDPPHYKRAA